MQGCFSCFGWLRERSVSNASDSSSFRSWAGRRKDRARTWLPVNIRGDSDGEDDNAATGSPSAGSFFSAALSPKGGVGRAVSEELSTRTAKRRLSRSKTLFQRQAGLAKKDIVMRHQLMRGAQRPIEDFYVKVGVLGEGAFGKVTRWRTKQTESDGCKAEEVAVKHIGWKAAMGSWWPDKAQTEELKQELKMLLFLDSPFIIQVREWFEHSWKGIYFVMELCDGGSLQDFLEEVVSHSEKRERMLYEPRLRRHFREMTYALSYLHSMDPPIVHRDLKPDNALMKCDRPESCVKLIDFGLTTLADDRLSTDDSWRQGTQVFMAPEQFLERPGLFTANIDIWALGIILGWMISALELGSLQHAMLEEDTGKEFSVHFRSLLYAYRDFKDGQRKWNRNLFAGAPELVLDLMDRILVFDPEARLHASDIVEHVWTSEGDGSKQAMLLDQSSLFENIRTYHELEKFEKIILNMVASSACAHAVGSGCGDRIHALRRCFRGLDTGNEGYLTEAELLIGFQTFHKDGHVQVSQEEVHNIFQEMDVDGSGHIDYTEFLAAGIGSAILMDSDSVSAAFRGLDSKNRGKIHEDDLMDAMGVEPSRLFCEAHGKSEFSYEEFHELVEDVAAKRWRIPTFAENNQRGSQKVCQ